MPSPLLRKKKNDVTTFDPVSAEVWAAGAIATAKIFETLDLMKLNTGYKIKAIEFSGELSKTVALTPCARSKGARTKPRTQWSFADYTTAVRVCKELHRTILAIREHVRVGQLSLFDETCESAAQAIVAFMGKIEPYAKLVKRERTYERISGNESGRRG